MNRTRKKLLYAMTQLDDYIQTYGGMNPVIHLANPIRFERLQVEPSKRSTGETTAADPIAPIADNYAELEYLLASSGVRVRAAFCLVHRTMKG